MEYIVLFEDNEAAVDQRSKYMKDHLQFLEQNSETIVAAGPLLDASWCLPAGGMWLVFADSVEEVEGLVKSDPFWSTGLRKSIKTFEWRQVFAQGQRRLA